jgi:hypothetical protein
LGGALHAAVEICAHVATMAITQAQARGAAVRPPALAFRALMHGDRPMLHVVHLSIFDLRLIRLFRRMPLVDWPRGDC